MQVAEGLPYESIGLSETYVQGLTAPARDIVNDIVRSGRSVDGDPWTPGQTSNLVFLKNLFNRSGFKIDPSFWETLNQDHDFELWSANLEFLVGCQRFIAISSYSIDELLSTPWSDLFTREDKYTQMLISGFRTAMEAKLPVLDIVPFHLVQETKSESKVAVMVSVKAMFPIFRKDKPNSPVAICALTLLRPPSV